TVVLPASICEMIPILRRRRTVEAARDSAIGLPEVLSITGRALHERYYSILAAAPEWQQDGNISISTTSIFCNLFDNHMRLDYTVVASTHILPIMVLVYCRS